MNQLIECLSFALSTLMMEFTIHKVLTPKKQEKLAATTLLLINTVIFSILSYSEFLAQFFNLEIRMTLRTIVLIGTILIYSLCFFKDRLKQKIISVVVVFMASFIAENIVSIIYVSILGISGYEIKAFNTVNRIYFSVVLATMYIIAMTCSYLILKKVRIKQNTKDIALFGIIILSFMFLLILITNGNVSTNDNFAKMSFIITIILATVISVAMYFIMKKINEQELLKEKLFWSETIKNYEYQYYENIKEKSDEIRKIRHDFRDQLTSVYALINKNTTESLYEANQLIENLDKQITSTKIPFYTENILINTLLGIKAEEINNLNIKIKTTIDLPYKIDTIENIDLNCVFINLINNAIDATSKIENEDNRIIIIKSIIKNDYLILKIQNPYNTIIADKDNKLITTKKDNKNHGIGTIIIENITKKYNGFYEISFDDNFFTSIVSLKIN